MNFSRSKQIYLDYSRFLAILLIVMMGFLGLEVSEAQEADKVFLEALPVLEKSIQIDGHLKESVWGEGIVATGFIQQEPFVGESAMTSSEIRIAYDDGNLYIGAHLVDPRPDLIRGDERQEDALFDRSDAFAILIDTYHDHQDGFFFETTPLSAKADALVSQEGTQVNRDWDGKWEVAARRTEQGWSAEFRIPFETLRFQPGDARVWGIQFRRRVPHLKEISFWSPLSAEQTFFEVSRAGHLMGVEPKMQLRRFSVKPYTKGSYLRDRTEMPDISETELDGGFDIRYRFRTNLTLDVTYNTDFAETEVDRIQINLTRFPLFFPEKREFFLEGKGFYDFGLSGRVQPFFSRRIGLINRQSIPILLGGKLSGKAGPYGIGMLLMETESEGVNPAERFGVIRLSRDIGLRSNIGIIGTDRSKRGGSGRESLGIDGAFSPNARLTSKAFWLYSDGNNSAERGQASFGELQWRDPFWRIKLNHLRIDETFSPALGFVQQTDLVETFGYVDIRPQPAKGVIREVGLKTEMTHQTDDSGRFLYRSNYNRIQADFRSGDFILLSIDPQKERLPEDFTIRPGITIPAGTFTYTHYSVFYITDSRRPLSGVASLLWGGFYDGRKSSLDISLTAAPGEGIKMGAGLEIDKVRLPQGKFTSQVVDGDIAWSLSNRLLLQGLIQWDKEDDSLAANLRLSWEYRENSWFYFIVNPARQDGDDTLLILTKITLLWEP